MQDQILLENQGRPDNLRLFGWHVPFTSDDNVKSEDIYDQAKIKQSMRIEFENTAMPCSDFLAMVMAKIHRINGECGRERIKVGTLNYTAAQLPDNMYKFKISLFGRAWT